MRYFATIFLLVSFGTLGIATRAWAENFVAFDEDELPISPDHFDIEVVWDGAETLPLVIKISRNSLIWKRRKDGNKFPQLTLSLNIPERKGIHFIYQGQIYVPDLFLDVDIFSNAPIQVVRQGKVLGSIFVKPYPEFAEQHFLYIDPSCAPYFVELSPTKDYFTSISCTFHPDPDRRGILDIAFAPAEGRLPSLESPPYNIQITGNGSASLQLFKKDDPYDVTVKAKVPEYVARLKMALGLGPYQFDKEPSMAYMLYARYDLVGTTSLRAFDALLMKSNSFFNNTGGYFAYQAGSTDDGRVSIYPLLGFQGITYKDSSSLKPFNQIIFPQGFEIVWRHVLGMPNSNLTYGMFLSTTSASNYENIWLRYGRGIFWELNWIKWKHDEKETRSYGLSVGIPFLSL